MALGAAALCITPAPPAQACGGFFCNQGQNPFDLPVAQTAENVLFAMERTSSGQFALEAHVQIFYTGPADRFSWVVPVDSKPTLGVGSNSVFSTLLNATQPRFGLSWAVDGTCKRDPQAGTGGSGGSGGAGGSGGSSSGGFGFDASADAGVSVSFRGDVGPYDAAIIKSTSTTDAKPMLDWLTTNKYFITPEGARLIEDYVRQDKYFVAIRLLSDRSTGEIQPLVMRFLGPGPCVPLKLTSIASIRDLRVNLWVLADNRVVPDNFYELEINQARIDWFGAGSNYEQLLKQAADQAGGQAFITEYAGPTSMLTRTLYQPGQLDVSGVARAPDPPAALNALFAFPRDSTLLGILRTHIPMPDAIRAIGVQERDFYNQLQVYWDTQRAAFKAFDGPAMAADLDAKMVQPLRDAQALFDKHRMLTRLATFISPEEMTVDPTFVMNADLPDVPAVRSARATRVCGDRQYTTCEAPVRIDLSTGEQVWFRPRPGGSCWSPDYERAGLDELPALYQAHARTTDGPGVARFDNTQMIRSALATRNAAIAKVGAVGSYPTTPRGDGSGCRVTGVPPAPPLLAPLAFALWWMARRRRR
jgi:hypothetical protein